MATAIKLHIAAILAIYTGRIVKTSQLQLERDPVYSDIWAVRWEALGADFVIDLRGSMEEKIESVEECMFQEWPPHAVHQN